MTRVTVSLDGRIVPPEEATISVFDHGFLFGDSVYEVVRTHRGIPYTLPEHLARLERSASRIGLEIPIGTLEMAERIVDTIRAADTGGDAYCRIIVTRGAGAIDIDPATCQRPLVILLVKSLPTYPAACYEQGVGVVVCGIERTSRLATDPGIKSGNYLNSVLAIMEARRRGAFEGLMKNAQGHLTEGTTSNIFFATGGVLRTPSPDCGILLGITRSVVIELAAAAGIEVDEGRFGSEDLRGADEAFITSTTRNVMPVATVDGQPLAGPTPGPITRRLGEALARRLDDETADADLDAYLARLRRQA